MPAVYGNAVMLLFCIELKLIVSRIK